MFPFRDTYGFEFHLDDLDMSHSDSDGHSDSDDSDISFAERAMTQHYVRELGLDRLLHDRDRASIQRYICNRWYKGQLHATRRKSKYYQWQLQKERVPGVGAHHPSVCDLVGLTQRGINCIKTRAVCVCGHCQARRVVILSPKTEFFAPLLVCKTLYFSLRRMVFKEVSIPAPPF